MVSPLEEGGAGLTAEDALHVLANEADTLQLAEEIITAENLDVDFWKGFKLEGGLAWSSGQTSVEGRQADTIWDAVQTTPEGVEKSRSAHEACVAAMRASKAYRDKTPEWQLVGDTEEAKKVRKSSRSRPNWIRWIR